jgi:hypothetical protein
MGYYKSLCSSIYIHTLVFRRMEISLSNKKKKKNLLYMYIYIYTTKHGVNIYI